jgi:hypothetical protein
MPPHYPHSPKQQKAHFRFSMAKSNPLKRVSINAYLSLKNQLCNTIHYKPITI